MSIIAISRGTFSGGEALAKAVAERLGYRCLSREANLGAVAKTYRVPSEELTAAMERRPSFFEQVVGEHTVYLKCVRAALCEEARGDNMTIAVCKAPMIRAWGDTPSTRSESSRCFPASVCV